ncbi:hypothetical protein T484DRAFT_1797532, partial [Baffinella frigidus]
FYIPQNTLAEGNVYHFLVRATDAVVPAAFTETTLVIDTSLITLTPSIVGGSRAAAISETTRLRVILAGNTKAVSALTYEWGCTPAPCFPGADAAFLIDKESVSLPANLLVPAAYRISVKVSAQIGLVFFEETTSVVIHLTPGAQPATQVTGPLGKYINSADDVALFADPAIYVDTAYTFLSRTLTEGQMYRFRVEISSTSGVGFAELDLLMRPGPSSGYLSVSPRAGLAVDTVFSLLALDWVDIPDSLPLSFEFWYALDTGSLAADAITLEDQTPFGQLSRQFLMVRMPNVDPVYSNATIGLTVINSAGCEASAGQMQALINEASDMQAFEEVVMLTNALAPTRRATLATPPCANAGGSCDNDVSRAFVLGQIQKALRAIVPKGTESSMVSNAVRGAITPFVNRSTQDAALALNSEILFASTNPVNGSGLNDLAVAGLVGTFSELLNASQRADKVAGAIDVDAANMVAFLLTTVFPGQNPKASASDHMSVMLARARLGSTNWTAPASKRAGLPNLEGGDVVSVDVVFVQWDTQVHPRGGKTLGSDTVTVNLTAEYANGSKVQQTYLEQPVVVTLAQETPEAGLSVQVRGSDTLDQCLYWDASKGNFESRGAIVSELSYTHVSCESYHLTDFASVLEKSFGDLDDVLVFEDLSQFDKWTPERFLALFACASLLFIYWSGVWVGRRADLRALGDLSLRIKHRDASRLGGEVVRSSEEEMRARDYVMIKAILKHRMASRYKSWRIQTLHLLKTEHIIGGIFFRPVFNAYTRPRRLTVLFVIFLGNITLNTLFIGRGGFGLDAQVAAGIVAAIVMFPIGLIFSAAFRAIDSEATWKMHRRRRVRRVQESVVVRGALDILSKPPPPKNVLLTRAGYSPPRPPGALAPGMPTPPRTDRPLFIRKASPGGVKQQGGPAPPPGGRPPVKPPAPPGKPPSDPHVTAKAAEFRRSMMAKAAPSQNLDSVQESPLGSLFQRPDSTQLWEDARTMRRENRSDAGSEMGDDISHANPSGGPVNPPRREPEAGGGQLFPNVGVRVPEYKAPKPETRGYILR